MLDGGIVNTRGAPALLYQGNRSLYLILGNVSKTKDNIHSKNKFHLILPCSDIRLRPLILRSYIRINSGLNLGLPTCAKQEK